MERGQRNIKKGCESAIWKTAQAAVRPIRRRVPVAFGELQTSVQAYERGNNGNAVTSVDAPHAGAVEIGSPPHKPDFERLLAWVKLRGLQALSMRAAKKRFPGSGGGYQVPRVGAMFRALIQRSRSQYGGAGRHSPADAAVQVAQAISKSIEARGTKPHWYVRESLPEIKEILNVEMQKAKSRVKG